MSIHSTNSIFYSIKLLYDRRLSMASINRCCNIISKFEEINVVLLFEIYVYCSCYNTYYYTSKVYAEREIPPLYLFLQLLCSVLKGRKSQFNSRLMRLKMMTMHTQASPRVLQISMVSDVHLPFSGPSACLLS